VDRWDDASSSLLPTCGSSLTLDRREEASFAVSCPLREEKGRRMDGRRNCFVWESKLALDRYM
jgi:hypothetical protein